MEKVNLTKTFLLLVTISEHDMNNFLKRTNGGHCGMVLIKNLIITTQHYTILTKIMDEIIRAHLPQLHNKLSNAQSTIKEVISYFFLCIILFFNQINT